MQLLKPEGKNARALSGELATEKEIADNIIEVNH